MTLSSVDEPAVSTLLSLASESDDAEPESEDRPEDA